MSALRFAGAVAAVLLAAFHPLLFAQFNSALQGVVTDTTELV